jgi:hypothetical protein
MPSSPRPAIALFLGGGFDDDDEISSSSSSVPAALRGIGDGPCSLERWLALLLPPPSLAAPSRALLVVAAGSSSERRVRSFLKNKKYLSPSMEIEVVVVGENGKELAATAKAAAGKASSSSSPCSLVLADAAAVPLPGLDLSRLQTAASLLAAPAVVVSGSPLGAESSSSSSKSGAEALRKTCKGLGGVSLLLAAAGSSGGGGGKSCAAVARVAAFDQEEEDGSGGSDLQAQRVAFVPASALESAAEHSGSVRSWLVA